MSADKPRRLGRGLEALLTAKVPPASAGEQSALQRIPVAAIRPNPYQPRKQFKPQELADLEASLKVSGLLQPIAVRRVSGENGYELIAGERRLRAATRLGWLDIPAVIKEIDDRTLLTLALVENLQRADLNPLEEAEGYAQLIREFELTQQQVAEAIGKDRSTIANMIRLLQLPASVRRMLQDGQLTLGHARALLALPNEQAIMDMARDVVAHGLTVRDVEQRARATNSRAAEKPASKAEPTRRESSEARRIADDLRRHFQTDVDVQVGRDARGSIHISFYSADDLDRILEQLLGPTREHS